MCCISNRLLTYEVYHWHQCTGPYASTYQIPGTRQYRNVHFEVYDSQARSSLPTVQRLGSRNYHGVHNSTHLRDRCSRKGLPPWNRHCLRSFLPVQICIIHRTRHHTSSHTSSHIIHRTKCIISQSRIINVPLMIPMRANVISVLSVISHDSYA